MPSPRFTPERSGGLDDRLRRIEEYLMRGDPVKPELPTRKHNGRTVTTSSDSGSGSGGGGGGGGGGSHAIFSGDHTDVDSTDTPAAGESIRFRASDSLWFADLTVRAGTLASRPAATAVEPGTLYLATDDNGGTLYRSDASTWTQCSPSVLPIRAVGAAAANEAMGVLVTGDTGPRHRVRADGRHDWGPGDGTFDVGLLRNALNDLRLTAGWLDIRGANNIILKSDWTFVRTNPSAITELQIGGPDGGSGPTAVSLFQNGAEVVRLTAGADGGQPCVFVTSVGHTQSSPAQITADQNNYTLPVNAYYIRLNTDAARTITGFAAPNAEYGREVVLVNVGSNDLLITNEDAASTAANRVITGTGATVTLSANESAVMMYDTTSDRWRILWRSP